jgi:hypothetical protein
MPERLSSLPGIGRARPGTAAAAIWLGCFVIDVIPMATTASAHVKWFTPCDASNDPLPLNEVFTTTFWLFTALFVALFAAACGIEKTAFGAFLSRMLNHVTAPLHRQTDVLLRAVAAVFFALLWADGSVILTPELKGGSIWLSAIQVLIAVFLSARATLPAAAAGIVVLYGYGAAVYGLFHMLDYTVFLGLAACFTLSVSGNARFRSIRFDCMRWTVALSLLWPAMEKFLYPAWVAPIAIAHPELTLGIDVATVITAAGVVEFGLAFALLWTPLVRRLAAAALALLLFAATFDFGKVDGIGHLMIIAILLLVFADPGKKQSRRRAALTPLVSVAALLAAIFLYAGGHALYYASAQTALAPLIGGAAFLTAGVLLGRGSATATGHQAPAAMADTDESWNEREETDDALAAPWPEPSATPRLDRLIAALVEESPPGGRSQLLDDAR